MPEQSRSLADLDWRYVLPWWSLVRVFRLALDPRKMVLAAVAMLVTIGGWLAIDWVFSSSDEVKKRIAAESPAPWSDPFFRASADAGDPTFGDLAAPSVVPNRGWFVRSPVLDSWFWLSRPFRRLFDVELSLTGFVYWLVSGLWAALVWGFFGGMITRFAALELAREDRLGISAALRHSRTKLGAYFWCPVYPLIGIALFALPMILLGWMLRFDVGLLLGAIIWPMFLVCGFLMAIVVIVFLIGWPLMWATISTEGTDTFDALSRTLAYVIQRPLHYLFYVVVVTLLGSLGWIVVSVFAAAIVQLSFWGVSWTSGAPRAAELVNGLPADVRMFVWQTSLQQPDSNQSTPLTNGESSETDATANAAESDPAESDASEPGVDDNEGPAFPSGIDSEDGEPAEPESSPDSAAETNGALAGAGLAVLAFWIALVKVVAIGFGLSYFWTSSSAVYLLMRRAVDATEMDEAFVDDEEEQYTLPPISSDAQGAPVVDDAKPGAADSQATDSTLDEPSGDPPSSDEGG